MTVTVTGISGFLGSAVALELLNTHPEWRIRGTVRSTSNTVKIDPLRRMFGDKFDKVELVEADILDAESLKRAFVGTTYVIHVASPVMIGEPADPETLIRPAVKGTTNMLTACRENGVRRVSITSSVAAITGINPPDNPDVYSEEHWSIPEQQNNAY